MNYYFLNAKEQEKFIFLWMKCGSHGSAFALLLKGSINYFAFDKLINPSVWTLY